MSTKKSTPKINEPKPKYAIDQIAYHILWHNGKPDELLQVKILSRSTRERAVRDAGGKKTGTIKEFSYHVIKPNGFTEDIFEVGLYPSFFEAAKVFAKSFLTLIK